MRQGSGCSGFRAGVRGLWGVPFLLRSAVRAQRVAGPQPELSPGPLGTSQDRRNAENLSESVGVPARAMQRFLTEPPGMTRGDGTSSGVSGSQAGAPQGRVGVGRQRLSQAGEEIGGSGPAVLRQTGQGGQLPGRDVPGLCQPVGRALVDKRLYLPESWTSDVARCRATGVPEERRDYRSKTELALEMLEQALELGHLKAGWVAADDAFGMSPSTVWRLWGALRPRCSGRHHGLALGAGLDQSRISGERAPPANPGCGMGSAGPWSNAVMSCRMRLGGR